MNPLIISVLVDIAFNQSFLRMKKIQEKYPSKYIIFNIWDDDHWRNFDAWWSIRNFKEGNCSFTTPYVSVNVDN